MLKYPSMLNGRTGPRDTYGSTNILATTDSGTVSTVIFSNLNWVVMVLTNSVFTTLLAVATSTTYSSILRFRHKAI